MKSILAALVLALISTTAAAPTAEACGPYGAVMRPERASGQWPSIARGDDGAIRLELHYPRFVRSGEHLYMDHFVVVEDRALAGLARRLRGEVGWNLEVSVVEVTPGVWRVTGWRQRA